mmetsp:Transcript_30088/g.69988  ORF Transcript_30088/g.69988 Transcript_30088/m.69988 type:complete len:293 (+) Transcript_30088:475-1353(+)
MLLEHARLDALVERAHHEVLSVRRYRSRLPWRFELCTPQQVVAVRLTQALACTLGKRCHLLDVHHNLAEAGLLLGVLAERVQRFAVLMRHAQEVEDLHSVAKHAWGLHEVKPVTADATETVAALRPFNDNGAARAQTCRLPERLQRPQSLLGQRNQSVRRELRERGQCLGEVHQTRLVVARTELCQAFSNLLGKRTTLNQLLHILLVQLDGTALDWAADAEDPLLLNASHDPGCHAGLADGVSTVRLSEDVPIESLQERQGQPLCAGLEADLAGELWGRHGESGARLLQPPS